MKEATLVVGIDGIDIGDIQREQHGQHLMIHV